MRMSKKRRDYNEVTRVCRVPSTGSCDVRDSGLYLAMLSVAQVTQCRTLVCYCMMNW